MTRLHGWWRRFFGIDDVCTPPGESAGALCEVFA